MNLNILKEMQPGEDRIALTPDAIKKLASNDLSVHVESRAGEAAGYSDADYTAAGAFVSPHRSELLDAADLVACIHAPPSKDLSRLRPGAVVIGFLRPLDAPGEILPLLKRSLTAFAVELIPRITRAQAMDALSSQASVAGYKAVVLAASRVPRMFPLMMTAAGTVAPSRVLVLGAGVAGLQAIATAKRLGAVVEAYDVRAAAGEAVRSLGAKFLEVDLGGLQTQDAGGYAVELSEEALERGRALIAERAQAADVIVTTAQIPGKPAPLLLRQEAMQGMRRGAVIVDLAASTGGNCEATQPGEVVIRNGVEIHGPLNLAATVPAHASQLYSNNITAFLKVLIQEGRLNLDMTDDVIGPTCVTHEGRLVNARVEALLAPLEKVFEASAING